MNKTYCDVCGVEIGNELTAYINTKRFGINVWVSASKDVSKASEDSRVDVCRECLYKAIKERYEE